ncbi:MAG TPA: exodeoxyribonuclease VII large subunit [Steroidobacteraceae bacterium]|jgi:exodeoxyribonuclease VII large subunit|nr:exodeoxyribonuclease VII large subunit [Steroidobacteraceae bacterium]
MAETPERNVYSVTRLNREVRLLLERGLAVIWLEAELSNFSQPASGHWYFTLKDQEAQIRGAMFRQRNSNVGFTPRSGQLVLVRGRVSLYEPRGDYQMILDHMEEAGVGALKREFERLKARLAAEGLFAADLKRSLPAFPRRIGVITSPSGAAVRDVLHILKRRYPPAQVLIYPTPVQGAAAVPALIEALTLASARADCDVLILARGGGSLEDLWAFNDEAVARAIRACTVPVVSGIGHEIDFTIADFVADVRAPTPSGAAELVVPDRQALLNTLRRIGQRLVQSGRRELRTALQRLAHLQHRLQRTDPGVRLQQSAQRLDELEQRLRKALRAQVQHQNIRLSHALTSLMRATPAQRVAALAARNAELRIRLRHALQRRVEASDHRLHLAQHKLHTVSPLATLARGFAVVTRIDGSVITDALKVSVGDEIRARVARGMLRARVTGHDPGSES